MVPEPLAAAHVSLPLLGGKGQLQETISRLQCFSDAQPHVPRVEGGSRKTFVRFSCVLVRDGSECVVTPCEWSLQSPGRAERHSESCAQQTTDPGVPRDCHITRSGRFLWKRGGWFSWGECPLKVCLLVGRAQGGENVPPGAGQVWDGF